MPGHSFCGHNKILTAWRTERCFTLSSGPRGVSRQEAKLRSASRSGSERWSSQFTSLGVTIYIKVCILSAKTNYSDTTRYVTSHPVGDMCRSKYLSSNNERTWLHCDYFIWRVSCTVVVLTCFVMCGCVYVWLLWYYVYLYLLCFVLFVLCFCIVSFMYIYSYLY